MFRRARLVWFLVLGAFLAFSGLAKAGGFPRAFHLQTQGPKRLVSMNFGLLLSVNEGASWHFICERALNGYLISLQERVEPLALFGSDGSIIVASERGLRVSRTEGCTFYDPPVVPISFETRERTALSYPLNAVGKVVGLAASPNKSRATFLVAGALQDAPETVKSYQLYETTDDAKTFSPLGGEIPGSKIGTLASLTVAPGDAARVYFVSEAPSDGAAELWISRNGGVSFDEQTSVPGSEGAGRETRLLGVHPADANLVFARIGGVLPGTRPLVPEHVLLMSSDAGATWQEVLRVNAKVDALAVSPDGKTLGVGVGCDHDTTYVCNPDHYGIYRAALTDSDLERIHRSPTTCLSWNDAGLFACSVPAQWTMFAAPPDAHRPTPPPPQEFVVAFHRDASFTLDDPAPLQVLALTKEVKGPIPWYAERPECFPDWIAALPGGIAYCVRFSNCPLNGEVIPVSSGPPVCRRAGAGGIGGASGIGGDRGWSGGAGLGGIGGAQWSATEGRACAVERPGRATFAYLLGVLAFGLGIARRAARRKR